MDLNEAISLLRERIPYTKIIICREYDSCFVFGTLFGDEPVAEDDVLLDIFTSVNKTTGEVEHFDPLSMPIEEYRRGVSLPILDQGR